MNGMPCAPSGHWLNLIMGAAAMGAVGLAILTYRPPAVSIPRPHPSAPVATPSPSPSVIPPPGIIVFPPPEEAPLPPPPNPEPPPPLPPAPTAVPCVQRGICNAISVQGSTGTQATLHPNGVTGKPSPR